MNRLTTRMKKAAEILLSDGVSSLLFRIIKSGYFRIRHRLNPSQRAGAKINAIAASNASNSEKFSLIYQKGLWLKVAPHLNPDKSLSGHGSTLSSTSVFRRNLEQFLRENTVQSFFDAPCGDFNWMKEVRLPDDCDYLGGDIVSSLIANLQKDFKEGPRRQFIYFDLTADTFPSVDVWLCKDCLHHLSNSDIILGLDNFRRSQVKIALISNHVGLRRNIDINTGQFRFVDLTLAPFNLPPPRQKLLDAPVTGEPRYVGVWRREDLS
jgi:hypothetical protein